MRSKRTKGAIDFCEIKTNGGAIDFCEAADFCCGGDQSVSKERQNGGGISVTVNPCSRGGHGSRGIGGTGTERRGDWEGNGNSEIVEC